MSGGNTNDPAGSETITLEWLAGEIAPAFHFKFKKLNLYGGKMKTFTLIDILDMNNDEIEKLENSLSSDEIDLILEQYKEYCEFRSPEEEFFHDYIEVRNSWLELGYTEVHEDLVGFRDTIHAYFSEDWEYCRSYLERFFLNKSSETVKQLDISQWDYRHIFTWFRMLINTDLYKEPDGTPIRTFFLMILKEGAIKRSSKLRDKFEDEVRYSCPDLVGLKDLMRDMIHTVR